MAAVRPFAFRFFASPVLNRLRRRYGLPGWSDFRRHFAAGTWCAYLDLPRFHPLAHLPDSHFFLGPIPWKPSGLPDFPLRGLGARRPLAYVTLGGSGDGSSLRQVLEALSGLDCDIALSGIEERAAYRLAGEFPDLEGRFQAACLANPDPVLERASFTVCHGGSGTVYQSLAAGVPLLCLPSNPDQGMVAADCARAGAGLTVEVWRATKKRAARAAQALLEKERYREQARRLGTDLGAFDTRQRWLDFLDRVRTGLPRGQKEFRA